jgi:hypothetical protein
VLVTDNATLIVNAMTAIRAAQSRSSWIAKSTYTIKTLNCDGAEKQCLMV